MSMDESEAEAAGDPTSDAAARREAAAFTRGRVAAMQDAMRHLFHRHVVELPPCERPLFLAPHPDDIIIGCGGTLQKLLAAGARVRLAYLTDGRGAATDAKAREAMAATRAAEARAVSAALGLPEPLLLGWDETSLCDPACFVERAGQLAQVLEETQADAVFVPYLWDQHGDHRVANHLLARAMGNSGRYPKVFGYEVWSVAPPGMLVDISAELERKQELLGLYQSQVALFPYQQMTDAVARSHASLIGPGCVAAEVFCQFDGAKFVALVNESDLTSAETVHNEVLAIPPSTW